MNDKQLFFGGFVQGGLIAMTSFACVCAFICQIQINAIKRDVARLDKLLGNVDNVVTAHEAWFEEHHRGVTNALRILSEP